MSETADSVKERPEGSVLAVATPDEDERLRALIRAELDRHYALPVARRALELMAETAAEPDIGSPGYRIVDRNGETRLRPVEPETPAKGKTKKKPRKGEAPAPEPEAPTVPMTLSELVEELREQHPGLFGSPPPEPPPPPPEPEHHASVGETVAHVRAAGAKFVGTQTALAKSLASSSAERGRALAAAAGETVGGWRQHLDERLTAHRTPTHESKAPDAEHPTSAASAPMSPATISGSAQATQRRDQWRAFGRNTVVRLRAGGEALRTRLRRKSDAAASRPPAPISVPTLHEVAGDLFRRRLLVGGLGGAAVLAAAFATVVLMREPGNGTATQESGAQEKPQQQAEAAPPASSPAGQETTPPQAAPASPPADPEEQPDEPKRADPNAVAGVPEVIDTATLRIAGKLVHLFGVEWVRGGQAEDLTKYLAGRAVTCQPASGSSAYLCSVNGRDLSEVVLFNGGGRASPEATPDLVAAEDRARSERLGVWKR